MHNLIQVLPNLRFQSVSDTNNDNREARSKRLSFWRLGQFGELLAEANAIHNKLYRSKPGTKKTYVRLEKDKFINAISNCDLRKAGQVFLMVKVLGFYSAYVINPLKTNFLDQHQKSTNAAIVNPL